MLLYAIKGLFFVILRYNAQPNLQDSYEKNISTKHSKKKQNSWLQSSHGYQGGKSCAIKPKKKRQKSSFCVESLALQKLPKPLYSSKQIRVFVLESSGPALRISTPKKIFKLAVTRNKIKRQIKDMFQKNDLYKDNVVFVVMVFAPFLSLNYQEASFEICKAVKSC